VCEQILPMCRLGPGGTAPCIDRYKEWDILWFVCLPSLGGVPDSTASIFFICLLLDRVICEVLSSLRFGLCARKSRAPRPSLGKTSNQREENEERGRQMRGDFQTLINKGCEHSYANRHACVTDSASIALGRSR
jgi:hypothetical protein